jgi:hypothetical protein
LPVRARFPGLGFSQIDLELADPDSRFPYCRPSGRLNLREQPGRAVNDDVEGAVADLREDQRQDATVGADQIAGPPERTQDFGRGLVA